MADRGVCFGVVTLDKHDLNLGSSQGYRGSQTVGDIIEPRIKPR